MSWSQLVDPWIRTHGDMLLSIGAWLIAAGSAWMAGRVQRRHPPDDEMSVAVATLTFDAYRSVSFFFSLLGLTGFLAWWFDVTVPTSPFWGSLEIGIGFFFLVRWLRGRGKQPDPQPTRDK